MVELLECVNLLVKRFEGEFGTVVGLVGQVVPAGYFEKHIRLIAIGHAVEVPVGVDVVVFQGGQGVGAGEPLGKLSGFLRCALVGGEVDQLFQHRQP